MFLRSLALATAMAAFALPAHALTATQKVEKEITVTQTDGTTATQRVEAERVTPGEKVVYTVEVLNDGAEPATDLVLAMPVPSDVRYLEGTADRPGAIVQFSVDGGESFAPRDTLRLPAVGGGTRPANPDDITHIQWRIAGPVAVGTTDEVAFKARLR